MTENPVINLLLVDDDGVMLQLWTELLSRSDMRVTGAESLGTAQALLEQNTFDVVVCDLNISNASGVELMSYLRAHKIEIPVIFFSGLETDVAEAQARKAGAFAFVPKTMDIIEMETRVVEAVNKAAAHYRAAMAPVALPIGL